LKKKVTIFHFNILEKYPPAMNFIADIVSQKPEYTITVFTSLNLSPYDNQRYEGVKIWRLGSVTGNSILRYLSYILYNLIGTLDLLIKRPDTVIVYETLSIFPAFIFSIFFKNRIHIHYHEYISIPEKEQSSMYMKFLFKCEDKLLKKITCSHTNEDRKALFLKDNPSLNPDGVAVYSNLPPKTWWDDYGQHKNPWKGGKVKLVYVGVLDAESMFLEEILTWVSENSEELELTIFSQSVSDSAKALLLKFKSNSIILKPPLNYYQLPSELVRYDIGLVLYKGHIPNYVYNVPNKVYEYLSCGLKVMTDSVVQSLKDLKLADVHIFEFKKLKVVSVKEIRLDLISLSGNLLKNQSSLVNIL
jgi:hypothetical protein